MDEKINKIVLLMRNYQRINNIKQQCVTNVSYLYNQLKAWNMSHRAKVKAIFAVSDDDDNFTVVAGHVVIYLDNETIIEPSYDVFNLKNIRYFDNIKDVSNEFKEEYKKIKFKDKCEYYIKQHIEFMKIAEQINNGEILTANPTFLNNQGEYVKKFIIKENK